MNLIHVLHTLSALSGVATVAFGSLWVKQYLKRSFCF